VDKQKFTKNLFGKENSLWNPNGKTTNAEPLWQKMLLKYLGRDFFTNSLSRFCLNPYEMYLK
jgi:hypothetical protein